MSPIEEVEGVAAALYENTLITGASAGLGEEFARQIAPYAKRLILVARRENRLEALSSELEGLHEGLSVITVVTDLVGEEARSVLIQFLLKQDFRVSLLINNAGIGDCGSFEKSDWKRVKGLLSLNIEALTHLTHALIPMMKERGYGHILNVSSLASSLPIPDLAVYAATKSYVTNFSEAVRIELEDDGIGVTTLCPGPVHTEFGSSAQRSSNEKEHFTMREYFFSEKERVVAEALDGIESNKARIYPTVKIAVAAVVISAIPLFFLRMLLRRRSRRVD